VASAPAHLFKISPAVLSFRDGRPGAYRHGATAGEAVITFSLLQPAQITITIMNAGGDAARVLEHDGKSGLNVVRWDLRPEEDTGQRGSFSPYPRLVEPGTYSVRIEAGNLVLEGSLTVLGP
jgi:hypothetical protein